jgi:hypothetical protein
VVDISEILRNSPISLPIIFWMCSVALAEFENLMNSFMTPENGVLYASAVKMIQMCCLMCKCNLSPSVSEIPSVP